MDQTLTTDRAMILAGGLGTRMQKQVAGVQLDEKTAQMADQGAKGLIPVGRPFLDHTLQALIDAGMRDFCLIVPPGASVIANYYHQVAESLDDATITFATQPEPLGTAHAVACGKDWAADRPFIVVNSDNFYTPSSVRALAAAEAPATIAYEREALIAGSNIPPDRIRRFAVLEIGEDGLLRRIVEKPDNPDEYAREGKLYVSMNCFLFTPEIFTACASIEKHPVRQEYELPVAVQYSIERLGQSYGCVLVEEGVLDLTGRTDIGPVRKLLAGHEVRFPAPHGVERE